MRPPDEVKRELVQQWFARAEEDFGLIEYLISSTKDAYLMAIGFHAQQAAEKFLKALLTWHQVEFRKTHDLDELLDLVAAVDAPFAEGLRDAAALTPYGVDIRYPGDLAEMTAEDASKAVELAAKIREAVRDALEGQA